MQLSEDWAPLYRRIFRSDEWRGQKPATKIVLVWIIGRVRHTDSSTTPAGSLDLVLDDICTECDLTRNTVRAALSALEGTGFIKLTRVRNGTRLTIVGASRWLRNVRPADVANATSETGAKAQKLRIESATIAPLSLQEEEEDLSASQKALFAQQAQPLRIASGSTSTAGYKDTIALFHDRFVEAYGAKPTWRAAEGSQLKKLLAAHGADEVQRRIVQLFTGAPSWLRPPYTFGTFVRHFDVLVVPAARPTTAGARRGGMSPTEIMAQAAAMAGES